jgi:O-antigen ligase
VKGKSFSLLILPKEMVRMNIQRDLVYYFPLTVSDFYLLVYFWLHFRKKETTRLPTASRSLIMCLVLFFLLNAVSVLWSEQYIVSLLSVVILFKFMMLFLLPGFVHFTSDVIKKMISVVTAFTIFESAWGFLQYIIRGNLGRYIESYNNAYTYGKVAWENSNLLRASGTFVDPDLFGTFMFMHFVLFFFLFLTSGRRAKFEKALYGLCAILSGASVFITGNRALYICFALSLVCILIMTKKVRYIISVIRKPIGFLTIAAVIAVLFPYVSARMQNLSAIFSEGSGTFRLQIADYAARLGFSNIFGVGLGTSPYRFALDFPGATVIFGPDYPHNIFFQIFAEVGISGLVAFIIFIYLAFRPFFLPGKKSGHTYFYLAAGAYLVSACFYPLYIPLIELPSFFFLYLGIAVFRTI